MEIVDPEELVQKVEGEQSNDHPQREVLTLPLGDLEDHTHEVLNALQRSNVGEPHIFQRGPDLARIVKMRDRIQPDHLDVSTLRAHLLRRFIFREEESDGEGGVEEKPISKPRRDLLTNVLSQPGWMFPDLESVARNPVYGQDWQLKAEDGYHPGAKMYVDTGDVDIDVPDEPTDAQVDEARALIVDDLLVDFPFARDGEGETSASVAHAVALGLLPFIRPALDEPAPLHLVSAPVHGTGKGKLVQALANVAIGQNAAETPEAEDDAEWRKRITSVLLNSPTFVLLDNLNTKLDSGSLASALTSRFWEDRRLGYTEQIRVRNDAVWVATANNPNLSGELSRRSVLIRMEPDVEKPWERDGFKHSPLLPWIRKNRAALVGAFLTLVERWKAAGQPEGSAKRFGSYPTWANTIGGILECAGIPGFMQNRGRLHREADREVEDWKSLVKLWWEEYGRSPVYSKQIRQLCEERELLLGVLGGGNERSQLIRLGQALGEQIDRVLAGYRISGGSDSHTKSNTYQLEPAD